MVISCDNIWDNLVARNACGVGKCPQSGHVPQRLHFITCGFFLHWLWISFKQTTRWDIISLCVPERRQLPIYLFLATTRCSRQLQYWRGKARAWEWIWFQHWKREEKHRPNWGSWEVHVRYCSMTFSSPFLLEFSGQLSVPYILQSFHILIFLVRLRGFIGITSG